MNKNICVGARETSSTSNLNDQNKLDPLTGLDNVVESKNKTDNQRPEKNTQAEQIDIESNNTNDKTKETAIDIDQAKKIRFSNIHNALIGHLNINSIRNKLNELKIISKDFMPTVLAISETKVDASFPNVQFLLDNHFNPGDFRKDRTSHGGGLMICIRKGTPCKRLQ